MCAAAIFHTGFLRIGGTSYQLPLLFLSESPPVSSAANAFYERNDTSTAPRAARADPRARDFQRHDARRRRRHRLRDFPQARRDGGAGWLAGTAVGCVAAGRRRVAAWHLEQRGTRLDDATHRRAVRFSPARLWALRGVSVRLGAVSCHSVGFHRRALLRLRRIHDPTDAAAGGIGVAGGVRFSS